VISKEQFDNVFLDALKAPGGSFKFIPVMDSEGTEMPGATEQTVSIGFDYVHHFQSEPFREGDEREGVLASIREAVAGVVPDASVTVEYEYHHALQGVALRAPAGSLDAIRKAPGVTAAFLQVGILDGAELRHQFLGRLGNGPFDIEALVLDPGLGPFDQRRIVQQHQLHVQERPGLGRCISRQLGGHALQLGLDRGTAFAQSGPFARHLPGGDVVARHIDERGIQHTGPPQHNATTDGRTDQRLHHAPAPSSSPKPEAIRSTSAFRAASSSSPPTRR